MKKIIATFCFLLSVAHAQSIQFVVTATAGGPNDAVTRKLVSEIEARSKYNFVVINKPGAAHTIGYRYIMDAKNPTLFISTPEVRSHDVYTESEEIFNLGYFTNTIYIPKSLNITTVGDFIQLSRTRKINFGHSGPGTYSHAAMKHFCERRLSNNCIEVGYKSGANGMLGVMTGEIDAYALVSYGVRYTENDKVRILHELRVGTEDRWLKIFSRNIDPAIKNDLMKILSGIDKKFYIELGLER